MLLSDSTIGDLIATNQIGLEPYDPELLQPASIDIRLDRRFRVFPRSYALLDPAAEHETHLVDVGSGGAYVLESKQFVLGATLERLTLPPWLAARVEGKSSLGRLGLMVHSTAGWVDPGFRGHITLELTNVGNRSILLRAGMRIGQLAFMRLDHPARTPYGTGKLGSHYQGQDRGPQPSRSFDGFRTWYVA